MERYVGHFRLLFLAFLLSSSPLIATGPQGSRPRPRARPVLPKACLESSHSSPQIAELQTTVTAHPSAGGYNTLGALFAEQKRLACAIPAFEAALALDPGYWEGRYNLALALIQKSEMKRAEAELRTVIRQKPDAVRAYYALGTLAQKSGRLEAAAEQFKAALNADPRFAFAALDLAQILSAQKRYSAVIFYLQKTLEAGPPQDSVELLRSALGMAYAQDGNFKQATETMKGVVSSHPGSAEAHFNLATVYARQGLREGYEAAVEEFLTALRLDPRAAAARISLAKALLSLQRYHDALPYLEEYTRLQPRDYEGFHVLGTAYKEMGQFGQAKGALERAAELNPNSYDVRYDLGVVLAGAGEAEQGIAQLEAAERLNPDAPEAHYQLGQLLAKAHQMKLAQEELATFHRLKEQSAQQTTAGNLNNQANTLLSEGETEAAVESYRKAVEIDPRNAQWRYNLSLALLKLGERRGAKQELEEAVQLDPNLSVAHNQLGLLDLEDARAGEAEREFKAVIDIDPANAEALDNLGILYTQEGKDTEAAELFRRAVESDSQYAKAYVNLGLTMAKLGNYPEAERQFQSALRVDSGNEGALTGLGMLQAKTGHGSQAVELFRKVAALHPNSAEAHLNLGIALADQFDLQSALKEFSESVRLNPDSAIARYNRGRVLYDLGKREEARTELENATRLSPNYASAIYLRAVTEGLSARALDLLEKVVALEPGNAAAQYLLGQNLEHQGRTEEAIRHWKLAVEADPNNYSALYNLARALSKSHAPEAKQYMDRFVAVQKTRQVTDRVQQLNNFALDAASVHNWPLAVLQLKEALEVCGQCPRRAALHRNLGLIYARKGDIENGEHELRMALEISPNDEDARKAIEILRGLQKKPPDAN